MPKKLKEIPDFRNEDAEREFWSKEDSTDYIYWSEADFTILPNLKPTAKTISGVFEIRHKEEKGGRS